MTWLLIRKFWPAAVIAILIGIIWAQGLQSDKIRADRDAWHKSALDYQVSAGEWEASFRQAETMRQEAQQGSVQAMNASAASCEARVADARSSAVKIERIVTSVPATCKPGESLPRVLVEPSALSDALGVRN